MPIYCKRPTVSFTRELLLSSLFAGLCFSLSGLAWGATIKRGLGPEPDSIHIHRAQGLAAINLLRDLREGLVTFDVHGEPVAGGVASSWEVLDGGLRYRFTLRPEARWSDGSPVTAMDFVRGWQRALSPATAAGTTQPPRAGSNRRPSTPPGPRSCCNSKSESGPTSTTRRSCPASTPPTARPASSAASGGKPAWTCWARWCTTWIWPPCGWGSPKPTAPCRGYRWRFWPRKPASAGAGPSEPVAICAAPA